MKSIKIVSFICMLVLFSAFSLTVTSVPSNGNTIYVDDDAPPEWYDETHVQTIQEGIDIASDGDTVYVYSGIYLENVNVDKSINLIGEEKDTTIIDGGENDHVVLISKDLVLISEFTMRNSSSGIYLNQFANQVTLSDNLIHNNQYIAIHAPFSDTMNLVISNNKIISNYFGIIS
ncbi:MAG: right-handed parallel beta-helix repeat-containing protein, partial [Thermoplasmatales archaeon]